MAPLVNFVKGPPNPDYGPAYNALCTADTHMKSITADGLTDTNERTDLRTHVRENLWVNVARPGRRSGILV